MDARFLAYVTVSALLIMAPGPDMALVARNAFRGGRRVAVATSLGVALGILGWGVASMLGIAALLAGSAFAFTLVKLAGAAYLLILGFHSLRAGMTGREQTDSADARPRLTWRASFSQGALGNLLNPKAAVIFITVVPQFIKHGDSPLRLTLMLLVFELMLVSWLSLYGYVLARAGQSSVGLRVRRGLQTVSGVVLMGFAVRLAMERR